MGDLQANAMWMNAFIHMSCQFIRLFETIFSSRKTISTYLQYDKKLFESCSCHTPLLAFRVLIHLRSTTPRIIWGCGFMIVSFPSRHVSRNRKLAGTIQYNTIQLFYCFISFHMRHSQNTFISMFNINTKNHISFSIMLNKRSIWKKKISILLWRTGCICWMQKFCYFFNCRTTGIQKVDKLIFII